MAIAVCDETGTPGVGVTREFPAVDPGSGLGVDEAGSIAERILHESERRNDERRAAAESQMLHGLGRQRKLSLPSSMVIIGVLAVLAAFFHAF